MVIGNQYQLIKLRIFCLLIMSIMRCDVYLDLLHFKNVNFKTKYELDRLLIKQMNNKNIDYNTNHFKI